MGRRRQTPRGWPLFALLAAATTCSSVNAAVLQGPPPTAAATIVPSMPPSGEQQGHGFTPCRVSTCEPASRAAAFVDSIGVNLSITDPRLFAGMLPLLKASGVRHVRVGMCGSVVQCTFFRRLHDAGIRGTVIEGTDTTPAELATLLTGGGPLAAGAFVEAMEGVNEPNNPGMPWYTPQWEERTRSRQQTLFRVVKSDPATAGIAVLGPSVCCNDVDQGRLGDLSGALDFGNMHDYFGVQNPGAIFYTGDYVIDHQKAVQAAISGGKPIVSTETGWGTREARPEGNVDDVVQQKYVLRAFLEHRLHGVARVFDFLFSDDASAGPAFASYGLVAVSGGGGSLRPKPAFRALTSLIAALADGGRTFQPTGLSFAISGEGASVDHLLLQRSDGSFDLLIWLEVPGWDKRRNRAVSYPPQDVTIVLTTPIASAQLLRFDGAGTLKASALAMANGGVSLAVSDMPEIVHLVPTGAPTTLPVPRTAPGFSALRNANSSLCLFVVNASLDPGTAVMQNRCADVRNQQFTVIREHDGSVLLRDANSRNCLREAAPERGAAIQTADGCAVSDPSQRFSLKPVGPDTYDVVARGSGLCFGVPGSSTVAGAQIQAASCDGSRAQVWSIPDAR